MIFKKLRSKMIIFNTVSVSLVMVIAFSVIFFATHANINGENQRKFEQLSNMPDFRMSPVGVSLSQENTDVQIAGNIPDEYATSFKLREREGRIIVVYSALNYAENVYAKAYEKTRGKSSGMIKLANRVWEFHSVVTYGFNNAEDESVIFLDVTKEKRMLKVLFITLVAVGLAMIAAVAFISLRFARRAVLPIEDSYNSQKQFIADASHELRTPLSIIGANMDVIEANSNKTIASQKEWLRYIRTELTKTGRLVSDLLYLAKEDALQNDVRKVFDLTLAAETAVASMEAALFERGISVSANIESGVSVAADEEKINRLIMIMLDNAGKYNFPGGRIDVSLAKVSGAAVFRVTNTGSGISAEDLPKIFDRFYRPDSSRSKETGGVGLGLSIAKTIVTNAGGKIYAASENGITMFAVELPVR
jgi:signal transduction histidine kinase